MYPRKRHSARGLMDRKLIALLHVQAALLDLLFHGGCRRRIVVFRPCLLWKGMGKDDGGWR